MFIIPAAIGAASSIIGGIIERKRALKDRAHLEEYTSPQAQVQRLQEAGLSKGMLYDSRAAGQSAMPNETSSGFEEAGKHLAGYVAHSLQRKQMDLVDAQIANTQADTAVKQATERRTWAQALGDYAESTVKNAQMNAQLNTELLNSNFKPSNTLEKTVTMGVEGQEQAILGAKMENDLREINTEVMKTLHAEGVLTDKAKAEYAGVVINNRQMQMAISKYAADIAQSKANTANISEQVVKARIENLIRQRIVDSLEQGQLPNVYDMTAGWMIGTTQVPDVIGGASELIGNLNPLSRFLNKK